MNLIDKDALVAEIEKRKHRNILNEGAFEEDIDILSFINTLEGKEEDLTWEDISVLRQIMAEYHRQVSNEMTMVNNEEFCKEVLRRFKTQKGESV